MSQFTQKDGQFFLDLSRHSISYFLKNKKILYIAPKDIPEKFKEKFACFVTLEINHQLRGCIGCLETNSTLYENILNYAISAAFHDPRFYPLEENELKKIKIEVSILSKPIKFNYSEVKELLEYLKKNKPGLIIEKNGYNATFLPQVWEDLPNVKQFLSQLCLKAGLSATEWEKGDLKIETYTVQYFKEK